jgi:hypothetical protein
VQVDVVAIPPRPLMATEDLLSSMMNQMYVEADDVVLPVDSLLHRPNEVLKTMKTVKKKTTRHSVEHQIDLCTFQQSHCVPMLYNDP